MFKYFGYYLSDLHGCDCTRNGDKCHFKRKHGAARHITEAMKTEKRRYEKLDPSVIKGWGDGTYGPIVHKSPYVVLRDGPTFMSAEKAREWLLKCPTLSEETGAKYRWHKSPRVKKETNSHDL